jgi:hypothetical protein
MPFVQPQYNISVDIFRPGTNIFLYPDVVVNGNLSPGRIVGEAQPEGLLVGIGIGGMWLRVPKGTDIRDPRAPAGGDLVICPSGSWRTYGCQWVDDIGCGFTNEHRFAVLQGFGPWPVPFPSGGTPGGTPPVGLPAALYTATSANVSVNKIDVHINVPYSGTIWQATSFWNNSFPPTVNTGAALAGSVHNYTSFGTVYKVAMHRVAVPAGASTITTQFPVLTAGALQIVGLYEPFTTNHQDATSSGSGFGMQPNCVPVADPLGMPVTLLIAVVSATDPPVGGVIQLPYVDRGSVTDTNGMHKIMLDVAAYNPPPVLPTAKWGTPMLAWQDWVTEIIEAA